MKIPIKIEKKKKKILIAWKLGNILENNPWIKSLK